MLGGGGRRGFIFWQDMDDAGEEGLDPGSNSDLSPTPFASPVSSRPPRRQRVMTEAGLDFYSNEHALHGSSPDPATAHMCPQVGGARCADVGCDDRTGKCDRERVREWRMLE